MAGPTPDELPAFSTPEATPQRPRRRVGCLGGTLIAVAVIAVIVVTVTVIQNVTRAQPADMQNACVEQVAGWAGVPIEDVSAVDVSGENFSGIAWDFRGSYPGGVWACGGPAGERVPSSTMVYPDAADGFGEEIFRKDGD